MKQPYLIQRGERESRDWKRGIDSLVKFDYMGSAEYEFGALPTSLGRIRENYKKYISYDYVVGCEAITCLFLPEHEEHIKDYLTKLSLGKFNLKERSKFDERVFPNPNWATYTDFWWDLENDIMFWIKDTEFEEDLHKTLATKPESKEDDNNSNSSKPLTFASINDLYRQIQVKVEQMPVVETKKQSKFQKLLKKFK